MTDTTTSLLVAIFASTGFWATLQIIINHKQRKKLDLEAEIEKLKNEIVGLRGEVTKQKNYMRSILHDRMCKAYEMAKKRRRNHQKATPFELDNLKTLYTAYKGLDGNSTGDKIFEEIRKELDFDDEEEKR